MTVYSCEPNLEAMLTCIYTAFVSRLGHQNIRLELEPLEQLSMFDEYVHVDGDNAIALRVMESVQSKISPYVYEQLAYNSMSCEPDVLDNMYHVMILGFEYGSGILQRLEFKDIIRFQEIHKRLSSDACRFKEFLRFHEVAPNVYASLVEPKNRIIPALALDFTDRMPSEHWMIVDVTHKEAAIHPKDEEYYIQKLTDDELCKLMQIDQANDSFTDLWQLFFNTIAIKERSNYVCQRNHIPLWSRKHVVEFNRRLT